MMRDEKRLRPSRTSPLETSLLLTMLLSAIVMIPATTSAQSNPPADATTTLHITDTPSPGNRKDSSAEAEIIGLKKQLADQQKQIDELRLLIGEQRKPMAGKSAVARASPAGPAEPQPNSFAVNP